MKKKFKFKPVELLLLAAVMCKNLRDHNDDFVTIKPSWDPVYIDALEGKVESAYGNVLGIDSRKNQKAATQKVVAGQKVSRKAVSIFKAAIEVTYKNDPQKLATILSTLGFTKHFSSTSKGNQGATVELLTVLQENLTDELIAELEAAQIGTQVIQNVVAHALPLITLNVDQEFLKKKSKEITREGIEELNDIYDEISSIGKIGQRIYPRNSISFEKFSMSGIVAAMTGGRPSTSTADESDAPTGDDNEGGVPPVDDTKD